MYELITTPPDGETATDGPYATVLDAARSTGHLLRTAGVATRVESAWFADHMARQPLGGELVHTESGYRFRIERKGEGEQS